MAVQEDVQTAVSLMLADPQTDENMLVQRLCERGMTPLRAELLVCFVPHAFGRAVIASLPGMPKMPTTASVPTDGRMLSIRLADIPEFAEALRVAEQALRTGTMSREQVVNLGMRGSELPAIMDGIQGGHNLTRSQVAPAMFMSLGVVAGFDEWYKGFGSQPSRAPAAGETGAQARKPWWRFWS